MQIPIGNAIVRERPGNKIKTETIWRNDQNTFFSLHFLHLVHLRHILRILNFKHTTRVKPCHTPLHDVCDMQMKNG